MPPSSTRQGHFGAPATYGCWFVSVHRQPLTDLRARLRVRLIQSCGKIKRMLRLTDFSIDCPDTMKLAAFYSEVTGLPVKEGSNENWSGIQLGEIELAFIRVEDYRRPQWPDSEHPKQGPQLPNVVVQRRQVSDLVVENQPCSRDIC